MTSIVNLLPDDFFDAGLREDVLRGLSASPKWLPPKWFYDERGSALFDKITELPEYYPTRAEREILNTHAADIAAASGAHTVVELGAGSADKTRVLLDALTAQGTLRTYVPVDVSVSALEGAVEVLSERYPSLELQPVVADFGHDLARLPRGHQRMVAFLGSTIGNLLPAERAAFLAAVRATVEPGDTLLLGTDLVKSPDVLIPAYDDAAGVTAEFNKNVLHVVNRELKADFDVEAFDHLAHWDAENEWIEMRLRSAVDQRVHIEMLGLDVEFGRDEQMRTEISAKFRPETVRAEVAAAGFGLREWWTDSAGRFGLSLSHAV